MRLGARGVSGGASVEEPSSLTDEPDEGTTVSTSEVISRSVTADGRTLRASVVAPLEPVLNDLFEILLKRSADWRDDFTLWFGWGPIILREGGDTPHEFVAHCPDYREDPNSSETDDLTQGIWPVVAMTQVLPAAGVEGQEIECAEDVICVIGWEESEMLQLSRIETTTPDDSGWFIEPFPNERTEPWATEELVRLPAWRVVQLRPAVMRALALPVGIAAIVQGDDVRAVIRESDREILASDL